MKFFSPAKINLFLRVLSRREDGYHELASLFQAVSLFDELNFSLASNDTFSTNDTKLPRDETNLVLKALHLFRKEMGSSQPFHIHLKKQIPIEAGLGGGSSNAATTLYALNLLHGFPFTEAKLKDLALLLGSDVPFFFSRGSAYGKGRGEIIENVPFKTDKTFWVVKPKEGLATSHIFKNLKLDECSEIAPKFLLQSFLQGKIVPVNDLEPIAFKLFPALKNLKEELLNQGFEFVFLTGSGSALICVGKNIPRVTYPTTCYPLAFVTREENRWYNERHPMSL